MATPSRRSLTLMILPDGGRESRTFRISYTRLRWAGAIGAGILVLALLLTTTWWFLALHALESRELRTRVAGLEAENARVAELGRALEELEASYLRIQALFAGDAPDATSPVWLPSPGVRTSTGAAAWDPSLPGSWPLTERGFVTQPLLEGAGGGHPGVDIAVPSGSYVRATAAGVVLESGEDAVYGLFLVIEHDDRYQSRYAHASQLFVSAGDTVQRNEVVALSGSTGRSTAPHLHFELLEDGVAVDPLLLVQRP